MMFPQIICSHSSQCSQSFVFYMLSKGENAGKPALKPWTNSFAVVCPNQQYVDFYYWLVYGLYKAGKFKVYLHGTAIPFINVNDVRNCIREVAPDIFPDWSKFQEIVNTLDKLEKLKTNLEQQIIRSEQLQQHLIRNYFLK